jgi:hypothetical protein
MDTAAAGHRAGRYSTTNENVARTDIVADQDIAFAEVRPYGGSNLSREFCRHLMVDYSTYPVGSEEARTRMLGHFSATL